MVVDGSSEFVGNNAELADIAFKKALILPKMPVHLSRISISLPASVHAHLETGKLDSSFNSPEAKVYAALALNRTESQVSGGENAGQRLLHASVARKLMKIGTAQTSTELVTRSSDETRTTRGSQAATDRICPTASPRPSSGSGLHTHQHPLVMSSIG